MLSSFIDSDVEDDDLDEESDMALAAKPAQQSSSSGAGAMMSIFSSYYDIQVEPEPETAEEVHSSTFLIYINAPQTAN